MKIGLITPVNFNPKTNNKNSRPAFGNFLEFKIPYTELTQNKLDSKTVIKMFLEKAGEIAGEIDLITGGNVNVYRRSLDDLDFVDRMGGVDTEFAQKVFVEDNRGKTTPELLMAANYLLGKGISAELVAEDLLVASNFGRPSILTKRAYFAQPKDMIKIN